MSNDVPRLVEHLFRDQSGKMVATLTRVFGPEHLQLAEDVVQDAMARALKTWPFHGVPENPSAWLMRVARNLALDHARRLTNFRSKEAAIAHFLLPETSSKESVYTDEEIRDDRLRLMFVCCHPDIPREAQVALALKTLCGFGAAEIAAAFLTSEAAVSKRLVRAKQRIRDQKIAFEIPSGPDLAPRLAAVLQTIYLLFSEGHKASTGDDLVREDFCMEAIRLVSLLCDHPVGDHPEPHALAALLCLTAARLPARTDENGRLIPLEQQDRSCWNQSLIHRGFMHLDRSAGGTALSTYHYQAAIAACHAAARDSASTDWSRILALYDSWMAAMPSPVVALNRAIAIARVRGAEAALEAIDAIPQKGVLEGYHLYHATLGELCLEAGSPTIAAHHFRTALGLATGSTEQEFLLDKIEAGRSLLSEAESRA